MNEENIALSIEELAECVKELTRIMRSNPDSSRDQRLESVYKKATRAKDRIKSL